MTHVSFYMYIPIGLVPNFTNIITTVVSRYSTNGIANCFVKYT